MLTISHMLGYWYSGVFGMLIYLVYDVAESTMRQGVWIDALIGNNYELEKKIHSLENRLNQVQQDN